MSEEPKKMLTRVLRETNVIRPQEASTITLHVNNGTVVKIVKSAEIKEWT